MIRPVLVTPSAELPVSVEEVKLSLRWDGDDLDTEIEAQIKAAVDHYEGWNGVLGISIREQEWRQDFAGFESMLYLPIGPVQAEGMAVTYRNAEGQISTLPTSDYAVRYDGGGRAFVRFDTGCSFPGDLYEHEPVSVTYTAGFETVPEDIKSAIKLRVQMHIDEAAKANNEYLTRAESALISKYRRNDI